MRLEAKLSPLGDSALLVELGDEIGLTANRRVQALAALLHVSPLAGMIEIVPAYTTLLVHYDPLALEYAAICEWTREKLEQVDNVYSGPPRLHEVPVSYGGEFGPDLEFVAAYHHLSVEEVIRIHSGTTYTVYMMGFTPGFPYMGTVPDAIATPRLETPRTRVPAGTVAVAGSQTGVYPIDSPGGWRLIGYTSLQLFDPRAQSPFLFMPGDDVRFVVER